MKSMKVAMDLNDAHCILCPTDKKHFALITDLQGKPVKLTDLAEAFVRDPKGFHKNFTPLKVPIGRNVGPNALTGVTPKTVVLCILHAEIRIALQVLEYHLRWVNSFVIMISSFFFF